MLLFISYIYVCVFICFVYVCIFSTFPSVVCSTWDGFKHVIGASLSESHLVCTMSALSIYIYIYIYIYIDNRTSVILVRNLTLHNPAVYHGKPPFLWYTATKSLLQQLWCHKYMSNYISHSPAACLYPLLSKVWQRPSTHSTRFYLCPSPTRYLHAFRFSIR